MAGGFQREEHVPRTRDKRIMGSRNGQPFTATEVKIWDGFGGVDLEV